MATHRVPCPACGETPTLYSGCKCSSEKTIEGWKIIAEGLANPLRNQLAEADFWKAECEKLREELSNIKENVPNAIIARNWAHYAVEQHDKRIAEREGK